MVTTVTKIKLGEYSQYAVDSQITNSVTTSLKKNFIKNFPILVVLYREYFLSASSSSSKLTFSG